MSGVKTNIITSIEVNRGIIYAAGSFIRDNGVLRRGLAAIDAETGYVY